MSKIYKQLKQNLSDFKFLGEIVERSTYYDEPRFWHYATSVTPDAKDTDGRISISYAGGCSYSSSEDAWVKCVFEGIERYAQTIYREGDLITSSYEDLHESALDIFAMSPFSTRQLTIDSFSPFILKNSDMFKWTSCINYATGKKTLIPAQLIYLSYNHPEFEPDILRPISTGAAAHVNLDKAIENGIYEIIERDSFMIFYLNKLRPPEINKESLSENIFKLIEYIKRYYLEVHLFDITTDLGIPAYMALILDRTGIGKPVSVGLKSGFDREHVLMGALIESLHTRSNVRNIYEDKYLLKNIQPTTTSTPVSITERSMFWYDINKISNLDFLFNGISTKIKKRELKGNLSVDELVNVLHQQGIETYYKDITPEHLTSTTFKVVKVIMPQLQPLFLDERYPYFGGKRLFETPVKMGYYATPKSEEELNTVPHPFL